ncbi:MAG: WG repeat-containing protein [Oscillospiraceae bacterium]
MKQRKTILAALLVGVLCMGLLPTTALAAMGTVLQEPTLVFQNVYAFDKTNTAGAFQDADHGNIVTIQKDKVVLTPFKPDPDTNKTWGDGEYYNDESTTYPPVITKMYSFYDSDSGKYGYENDSGVVIPAIYDTVDISYVYGDVSFLPVCKDGKWGAIDLAGQELVAFKYARVSPLENGLATFGITSTNAQQEPITLYGYMDQSGTEVIAPTFANAENFSKGGVAVVKNSDYEVGLVSKEGKMIVPFGTYDSMYPYADRDGTTYISTSKNGLGGCLSANGTKILPCLYVAIDNFDKGLAVVETVQGKGLVDSTGGCVIPAIYDHINTYLSGNPVEYVWVCKNDKYGVVKVDRAATAASKMTLPATAFPSTNPVTVDGQPVNFDVYALLDANGNLTNYFKVRDVANILNGTAAQFQVGWDKMVNLTTKTAYTANGSEMSTPFYGCQIPGANKPQTMVNGTLTPMDTLSLADSDGNGYTYYKIRDLGKALGFDITYDGATGTIGIDTTKPYAG